VNKLNVFVNQDGLARTALQVITLICSPIAITNVECILLNYSLFDLLFHLITSEYRIIVVISSVACPYSSCSGNGQCAVISGIPTCQCNPGYHLQDCSGKQGCVQSPPLQHLLADNRISTVALPPLPQVYSTSQPSNDPFFNESTIAVYQTGVID
jgi:hypothetical protein